MKTFISRYLNFPVNYFGIALGTIALALAWRYAAQAMLAPQWGAQILAAVGVVVWLVLLASYGLRWIYNRESTIEEFKNMVSCCFISLIPVTTLEVALIVRPLSEVTALILTGLGIVSQLVFAVYRTPDLWRGKHSVVATTPIVYLPAVASNFSTAAVLGVLGQSNYGWIFFGAGLLSWFSLEASILGRLRTESELPAATRGIIGIQLAPPFVGAAALLALNGGAIDVFVLALAGYGLLQFLYFLRLTVWIFEGGFTKSLWGFSFGLAAMANVGAHLAHGSSMHLLGLVMFWAGSILVLLLWLGNLLDLRRPKKKQLPLVQK